MKIEVILDRNSVEAFFFDWYSYTTLVFTDEKNRGIQIWSELSENQVRVKYASAEVLQRTMFPPPQPRSSIQ